MIKKAIISQKEYLVDEWRCFKILSWISKKQKNTKIKKRRDKRGRSLFFLFILLLLSQTTTMGTTLMWYTLLLILLFPLLLHAATINNVSNCNNDILNINNEVYSITSDMDCNGQPFIFKFSGLTNVIIEGIN